MSTESVNASATGAQWLLAVGIFMAPLAVIFMGASLEAAKETVLKPSGSAPGMPGQ